MKIERHVIIGCGIAAVSAAEEIRRRDPDCMITVFNGEPFPYYFRAALSFYFKSAIAEDELLGKPPSWAKDMRVRMISDRVSRVRAEEREVVGESGVVEPYDKLLIATGAWPFKAPWIGADLDGVFTYRTLVCAKTKTNYIRKHHAKKAVIVGGGILGVEMVENLVNLGLETTLLVREDRPLGVLFDEEGSKIVQGQMESDDVRVMTNTEMAEVLGSYGRAEGVKLSTGEELAADVVVVAIGVRPRTEFLEGSGVEAERGVAVDERMRTNVEDVYAAGDVAVRKTPDGPVQCRNWLTAGFMGRAAGANMAGADERYDEGVFFNASHAYRSMYALVGRFQSGGDGVRSVVLDSPPATRAKVNVDDEGKIVGGMFIGHTAPAWGVYRAVEKGLRLSDDEIRKGALYNAPGLPQLVF